MMPSTTHAISFHAYPALQETNPHGSCGSASGDGYGPMIASSRKLPASVKDAHRRPRHLTTAYLTLQLFAPDIETRRRPLRQDIPRQSRRDYEAGLIIPKAANLRQRRSLLNWLASSVVAANRTGLRPFPLRQPPSAVSRSKPF